MTQSMCICNPKGGTGKTTTAICIAEAFARDGKRVLIIDMDKLGIASKYFSKYRGVERLKDHVITGGTVDSSESDSIIQHTSNTMIDIIPLENTLKSDLSYPINEDNILYNTFTTSTEPYDFCIIDTNRPDLRFEIAISHNLFIPVSDYLSIGGINHLIIDQLDKLNDLDRATCQLKGVLLTMYDSRSNIKKELKQHLSDTFGERLLENTIPSDMNIQKSQTQCRSIFEYSPESPAAVAYLKVAKELMTKLRD